MADPERTLTFVGHLEELRRRLIVSAVAWLVATALAFPLAQGAIGLLTRPLKVATTQENAPRLTIRLTPKPGAADPSQDLDVQYSLENVTSSTRRIDQLQVDLILPSGAVRPIGEGSPTGSNIYYSNITEPVWLIFKAALILGIVLALPVWGYQLWAFIAPGLKMAERKAVRILVGLTAILFPCGILFAYFFMSFIIRFLLGIQIAGVAPLLEYSKYASFAMTLMVAFGILFELPVGVLLLAFLGLVTPALLRTYRPHAFVIIAFLAMILTPGGDPISMVLMIVPLAGLYELSIWLTYMAIRKKLQA